MNNPIFTFIIPIYNTADYLERCLHSVTEQSFKDVEILLINDGSTDHSGAICEQYASQDSRITVIHQENRGLSGARNTGIRHAKGEYLLFLDSDDYVEKDTAQQFVPYTKTGADILIGRGITEGANALAFGSKVKGLYTPYEFIKNVYPEGRVPMAAVIYILKRDFVIENNLTFKEGIFHEDEEFTPRALLQAKGIYKTDIPFYHYVRRDDSITRKKDLTKNLRDLKNTIFELEKIYSEITDQEVKKHLLNSLTTKYLSLFQDSGLYDVKEFHIQDFLLKNASGLRGKLKAHLFAMSPSVYWRLNHFLKTKRMK